MNKADIWYDTPLHNYITITIPVTLESERAVGVFRWRWCQMQTCELFRSTIGTGQRQQYTVTQLHKHAGEHKQFEHQPLLDEVKWKREFDITQWLQHTI